MQQRIHLLFSCVCLHSFRGMSLNSKIAPPEAEGICFHRLLHKARLICQGEHDWRVLPHRPPSCIDHLLSRLPFSRVTSAHSLLLCCTVFIFYKLLEGTQGCVIICGRAVYTSGSSASINLTQVPPGVDLMLPCEVKNISIQHKGGLYEVNRKKSTFSRS